jgi:hypothetical protein
MKTTIKVAAKTFAAKKLLVFFFINMLSVNPQKSAGQKTSLSCSQTLSFKAKNKAKRKFPPVKLNIKRKSNTIRQTKKNPPTSQ